MKTLKESLLDNVNSTLKQGPTSIKDDIKAFLKQVCNKPSQAKISRKPNEDGLYVVDWKSDLMIIDKYIEQLTNDLFTFGEVNGDFICSDCGKLKTLKGAPKIVHGDFDCRGCIDLESLKGGPQIVDGTFNFSDCSSLTTLEGAPQQCTEVFARVWFNNITLNSLKGCPQAQSIHLIDIKGIKNLKGLPQQEVENLHIENLPDLESLEGVPTKILNYTCVNCQKLKSLKGCPSKVPGEFVCDYCHSLKNFEGFPKEVGRLRVCNNKMLDGNNPEVLKGFPKEANKVEIFISKKEQERLGVKLEPFTVEQICAVCDVDPREVYVIYPFDKYKI